MTSAKMILQRHPIVAVFIAIGSSIAGFLELINPFLETGTLVAGLILAIYTIILKINEKKKIRLEIQYQQLENKDLQDQLEHGDRVDVEVRMNERDVESTGQDQGA